MHQLEERINNQILEVKWLTSIGDKWPVVGETSCEYSIKWTSEEDTEKNKLGMFELTVFHFKLQYFKICEFQQRR